MDRRKAVPYEKNRRFRFRLKSALKRKQVSYAALSERCGICQSNLRNLNLLYDSVSLRDVWVIAIALNCSPESLIWDPMSQSAFKNPRAWAKNLAEVVTALSKVQPKFAGRVTFIKKDCALLRKRQKVIQPMPKFGMHPTSYVGPYHFIKEAYDSEPDKRESLRRVFDVPYSDIQRVLDPNRSMYFPIFQACAEQLTQLSVAQLLRGGIAASDHGVGERALLLRLLQFIKAILLDCEKAKIPADRLKPFEEDIIKYFGFPPESVQPFKPTGGGEGPRMGRITDHIMPDEL